MARRGHTRTDHAVEGARRASSPASGHLSRSWGGSRSKPCPHPPALDRDCPPSSPWRPAHACPTLRPDGRATVPGDAARPRHACPVFFQRDSPTPPSERGPEDAATAIAPSQPHTATTTYRHNRIPPQPPTAPTPTISARQTPAYPFHLQTCPQSPQNRPKRTCRTPKRTHRTRPNVRAPPPRSPFSHEVAIHAGTRNGKISRARDVRTKRTSDRRCYAAVTSFTSPGGINRPKRSGRAWRGPVGRRAAIR